MTLSPRRFFILASLLLLAAAPAPTVPEEAKLADVKAWFKATNTMSADFIQTSANGVVVRGKMILSRPGKIRFEYEPKVPLLVVANGTALYVVNSKNRTVQRWPIRNTPLAVLLDSDIDIGKYAQVAPPAAGAPAGAIELVAKDTKRPQLGVINLYFYRAEGLPAGLSLAGWRVVDAQGNNTQIQLGMAKFNEPVARDRFTFVDPRNN